METWLLGSRAPDSDRRPASSSKRGTSGSRSGSAGGSIWIGQATDMSSNRPSIPYMSRRGGESTGRATRDTCSQSTTNIPIAIGLILWVFDWFLGWGIRLVTGQGS